MLDHILQNMCMCHTSCSILLDDGARTYIWCNWVFPRCHNGYNHSYMTETVKSSHASSGHFALGVVAATHLHPLLDLLGYGGLLIAMLGSWPAPGRFTIIKNAIRKEQLPNGEVDLSLQKYTRNKKTKRLVVMSVWQYVIVPTNCSNG